MTSSNSMAFRAFLAVALMIGFYLLAVGVALGLLYIPYAEVVYAHRIHLKLALGCLLGGLAILWSVVPRVDKFVPPGPRLTPDQQPRLFQDIAQVARAVGQEMPAEVYLVPDVNAWVSQRGGIMGFGGRRVMGLGLSLMRLLSRSEFQAVLAHEFGHYHGGDTRLGPWIYKTRAAIGRTLQSLGDGSILQLPFLWYGKMFLRITHAVSRCQEFQADALAARTVGARPLITGLQTVHGAGPAFQHYWIGECAPLLQAGFQPPLAEGFYQFVQSSTIAGIIRQAIEEEMRSGKADPYDTHPPLKERVAAVMELPPASRALDDTPAIALLENLPGLEAGLLAAMAGPEHAARLAPVSWAEVCEKVYLPQWRRLVAANRHALDGLTPESLPERVAELPKLAPAFVQANGDKINPEASEGLAAAVIGAAVLLAVLARGGTAETDPGNPVSVTLHGVPLQPFNLVRQLAGRELSASAWAEQCRQLGITGWNLGQGVSS